MSKQTRQIGGVQLIDVQKEQAAQKAKSRFSLALTEWVQAEREASKAMEHLEATRYGRLRRSLTLRQVASEKVRACR